MHFDEVCEELGSNLLLAMGDGECPYESEAAWNYVAKLIEQLDGAYTSGSSAVYKGVTNGEYVVGLTYEVGAVGYIANGAQGVRTVYPTKGVCWTPVGSAIVNGAKNVETAKLFMDWLISEENQAHMASVQDSVLRGVRTDLFVANEYMPAFDTLNLKQEDSEYTSGNKQTILNHWNDLWNKQAAEIVNSPRPLWTFCRGQAFACYCSGCAFLHVRKQSPAIGAGESIALICPDSRALHPAGSRPALTQRRLHFHERYHLERSCP